MFTELKALQFGDFILNPPQRQLYRLEERLTLPVKAFDLLLYMAQNPGRPLLKNELLSSVWPDSFVEESNLSQTIFLLRKALGPAGEGIILTLPGKGYQFTAQITPLGRTSRTELEEPSSIILPVQISATQTRVVIEQQTEEHIGLWRSRYAVGVSALMLVAIAAVGRQRWEDRVGGPPVQVVLAESDGSTGDAMLDRTLAGVMRIELAQSPFINLVSAATVKGKLAEMEHKPDEKLTLSLAREVCERVGSQAVIHGSMARAGGDYVITEEAINCLDGTTIGAISRSVRKPEELPGALAKMASELRHSLGESRRTIARFASPLYPATTSSLEALEKFTEAMRFFGLGQYPQSTELLKQAVVLDPNFATAWMNLSINENNFASRETSNVYLQKAYDLRSHATEPTRLFIVARYESEVTGDLYEGVRNYKSWAEIYPGAAQPWSGLAFMYRQLGQNAEALGAAKKTMDRLPSYYIVNYALADAQSRFQDYSGARATCQAAVARGLDGDELRDLMLRLGHLQHDPAYLEQQEAWGREHPDSVFLRANQAMHALSEGRMIEANKLLEQMRTALQHSGQSEMEGTFNAVTVSNLAVVGEMQEARRLLATVPVLPTSPDYLLALVDADEASNVETMLADQLRKQPRSTLWNEWYGPILRGKLLLKADKPQEALTALAPTRQFDGRDYDGMYTRGLAYIALGQFPSAEAEMSKIVAHPELNSPSPLLPLAQVQLARVLAMQGKTQEAAEAYLLFLAGWAHADEGQPLLLQVRKELQALPK